MKPVITDGLTVARLKEIIKDWPEFDSNGESCEVWMELGKGLSSQVREVWPLNKRDNGVISADMLFGLGEERND